MIGGIWGSFCSVIYGQTNIFIPVLSNQLTFRQKFKDSRSDISTRIVFKTESLIKKALNIPKTFHKNLYADFFRKKYFLKIFDAELCFSNYFWWRNS